MLRCKPVGKLCEKGMQVAVCRQRPAVERAVERPYSVKGHLQGSCTLAKKQTASVSRTGGVTASRSLAHSYACGFYTGRRYRRSLRAERGPTTHLLQGAARP